MEFIAEIGSGHAGSLSKAKELISAAKESKATTVKFQWIIADEIVHRNIGTMQFSNTNFNLYKLFKQVERDIDFYKELQEYTIKYDMDFLCSVFGLQSLADYQTLNPNSIKIASPEINHFPLLHTLAHGNSNIIISTGLASLLDIQSCIEILSTNKVQLLHCVTQYPATCSQYNLSLLSIYQQIFDVQVGVSDHSNSIALIPALSVLFGASIIEKHFTIDTQGNNIDDPIALTKDEFLSMVTATTETEKIIQNAQSSKKETIQFLQELAKKYTPSINIYDILDAKDWESPPLRAIYPSSRRSIFSNTALHTGKTITNDTIHVLRSEKNIAPGIPSEYLHYIENLHCTHTINKNNPINFADLEI